MDAAEEGIWESEVREDRRPGRRFRRRSRDGRSRPRRDRPHGPRISLTGGVNELTSTVPQIPDRVVNPLVDGVGDTVEEVREDGTVSRSADLVTGAADSAGTLLGGLPLGG